MIIKPVWCHFSMVSHTKLMLTTRCYMLISCPFSKSSGLLQHDDAFTKNI